uniref:Uncharacterized protein n=1 Tax=Rhizophora mucronata TaxID=61149 RepID=A0A2P2PRT3_RHIMU
MLESSPLFYSILYCRP